MKSNQVLWKFYIFVIHESEDSSFGTERPKKILNFHSNGFDSFLLYIGKFYLFHPKLLKLYLS